MELRATKIDARAAVAALCLVLAAALPCTLAGTAAAGMLEGRILYAAISGGHWDLFLLDPDTGVRAQLTRDAQMERFPAVSPGGSRVLFTGDRKEVWLYDPASGLKEKLPFPEGTYGHPAWAPDGRRIAYVSYTALPTDKSELWVAEETGGRWGLPRQITQFPPMLMNPAWAPSGDILACTVFRRDPAVGVVEKTAFLRPPEWKLQVLPDQPEADSYGPAWSPDGRRIAYTSNRAGNYDVWVRDLSAGGDIQVTDGAGFDGEADFSPAGDRIVFVSDRSGHKELWVAPAQGGGARQLTELKQSVATPVWVAPATQGANGS